MAGLKSIDEAAYRLEHAVIVAQATISMCKSLTHEADDVPWLVAVGELIDEVDQRATEYLRAVHVHARPVLRDLEGVAAAFAGRGV